MIPTYVLRRVRLPRRTVLGIQERGKQRSYERRVEVE